MPRREHTSKVLGYTMLLKGSHSFTSTSHIHPLTDEPYLLFPAQPKLGNK